MVGLLELGAVVGVGVAAQPVHHDEEDLGVGRLDQRREVHAGKRYLASLPPNSWLNFEPCAGADR